MSVMKREGKSTNNSPCLVVYM